MLLNLLIFKLKHCVFSGDKQGGLEKARNDIETETQPPSLKIYMYQWSILLHGQWPITKPSLYCENLLHSSSTVIDVKQKKLIK